MTLYSFILFLHIVGALGLFIALGLEWTSLGNLRRAITAEQAHPWLLVFASLRRIYPISWVTLLLSGIYMTAMVWRGAVWPGIALATMILIAILGAVLSGRRMAAIGPALAAEKGSISPTLRQQLRDLRLWTSIQVRAAMALGIVFLMAVKPGLSGALITIGVAIVLGLALAWWPAWGQVMLEAATPGVGSPSEAREEN
jgi:hypothetical protein